MNHDVVKQFKEKLDRLNVSDYHGLSSPGLTCYLNSVLQVLFMTEDFRKAMKRSCSEHSATIEPELVRLFDDLQRNIARTHDVTDKLGISNVYEQRDAAEYFEKILCLTSSEATRMFKGELNHKSQCLRCKEKNDCRSFFWILPLTVEDPSGRTYSVEKGLKAFFKGEKVCGDNKMFCSRCNDKQDAHFECEMTQSPDILTLLLKRFSFDNKLRCFIKLHCNVDVPETLHIKNCKYDLYALVDHFGNLTGGHYTAQIKSFETHMWYHFNDDTVNEVKQQLFAAGDKYLRSSTAYLLMYRKVSKNPEKTDEGDQESLCTQSDVEAEGRYEEAERGEALVSHRQPKQESFKGQETVQHLHGEILKKSHDDTIGMKQTNLRAGCGRTHHEMLQSDSVEDGDSLQTQMSNFVMLQKDGGRKHHEKRRQLDTNLHHVDSMIEQNRASSKKRLNANETVWETPNYVVAKTKTSVKDCSIRTRPAESKAVRIKKEAVTEVRLEGNSAKQEREAGVGACMCNCDGKSYHVSPSDCSSAAARCRTAHMQSPSRMREHSGGNFSKLSRKSKSPNSDKETEGSSCNLDTKTGTKGSKTSSCREKKEATKSRDKDRKEPWK
ncbi:ubiquitin carboxyl-terminal hydrolase 47-like [Centropristis striata]|uniref:ubiquitin carboxyl-terminal hydrolase 47-like n=1 Tax=Centropristis striata TaxID=184440 RepID=UPI0027E1C528|nr:ubiquitin carboxyl-terminal hydrolase 47-like [Centropristis striata]